MSEKLITNKIKPIKRNKDNWKTYKTMSWFRPTCINKKLFCACKQRALSRRRKFKTWWKMQFQWCHIFVWPLYLASRLVSFQCSTIGSKSTQSLNAELAVSLVWWIQSRALLYSAHLGRYNQEIIKFLKARNAWASLPLHHQLMLRSSSV